MGEGPMGEGPQNDPNVSSDCQRNIDIKVTPSLLQSRTGKYKIILSFNITQITNVIFDTNIPASSCGIGCTGEHIGGHERQSEK